MTMASVRALRAGAEIGHHRAFDEDAGAVGADFARRIEIAEHRARDGIVEIGIGEDDQRAFAAEFQRHRFERRGGVGHDFAAGADFAGERDLGDARVAGEQAAGVGEALHHLEQALGAARLQVDFFQLDRGERGEFGGFEDHRIATGERGGAFPAGDLEGVIPGADAGGDAQGFAPGVAEGGGAEVDMFAREGGRDAGEIFDGVGARGDIDGAGFLDRLAGVEGFEAGEIIVARAQEIDGAA